MDGTRNENDLRDPDTRRLNIVVIARGVRRWAQIEFWSTQVKIATS
jgi:hypothetical protein